MAATVIEIVLAKPSVDSLIYSYIQAVVDAENGSVPGSSAFADSSEWTFLYGNAINLAAGLNFAEPNGQQSLNESFAPPVSQPGTWVDTVAVSAAGFMNPDLYVIAGIGPVRTMRCYVDESQGGIWPSGADPINDDGTIDFGVSTSTPSRRYYASQGAAWRRRGRRR